jgi:hypothetical protein
MISPSISPVSDNQKKKRNELVNRGERETKKEKWKEN